MSGKMDMMQNSISIRSGHVLYSLTLKTSTISDLVAVYKSTPAAVVEMKNDKLLRPKYGKVYKKVPLFCEMDMVLPIYWLPVHQIQPVLILHTLQTSVLLQHCKCTDQSFPLQKIPTFPKLPFPSRERKLKSENRMTSWRMILDSWMETRCFSSSETDCQQNTNKQR